jgi:hypothetical protein
MSHCGCGLRARHLLEELRQVVGLPEGLAPVPRPQPSRPSS